MTPEKADPQSVQSQPPKGLSELVGSLVDILAKILSLITWPVVILIVIIAFYSPVNRIVQQLPDKFSQSSEITVGTLISLKIREQAKASGNEELAKIIEGLSQDAIKWILKIGDSPYRVIGTDDGGTGITTNYILDTDHYSLWIELSSKGLLKSSEDLYRYRTFFDSLQPTNGRIPVGSLTEEQKDRLLTNDLQLTDSGKRAYEIILEVIAESIGQK